MERLSSATGMFHRLYKSKPSLSPAYFYILIGSLGNARLWWLSLIERSIRDATLLAASQRSYIGLYTVSLTSDDREYVPSS